MPLSHFARDTLSGLSATSKYLLPKYFYDDHGSQIFQDIMNMPEYYLTDCELEIFTQQKKQIVQAFQVKNRPIDLIELGGGDGLKTKVLLKEMLESTINVCFIPIDISKQANRVLEKRLRIEFPHLKISPKTGDYFHITKTLQTTVDRCKIILFLGSNIGNFSDNEIKQFLAQLSEITQKGDMLFIGFDLKKNPQMIELAYKDPHGLTESFNKNLLSRINLEFDADFDIFHFQHHASYDPITGELKSYLLSDCDQTVTIKRLDKIIHFQKWEPIFMERSRKFDVDSISNMAAENGFTVKQNFVDKKSFFMDSLWIKK